MSDLLCITNRHLCGEDFLNRVSLLAKSHPRAIVLREKDLCEADYAALAKEVLRICKAENTLCILHTFPQVAASLGADALHMPLPLLVEMSAEDRVQFKTLGASCHSVEDAVLAQNLGCTYITAGHIYSTDCKKGLPPRGLDFLKSVTEQVSIPVYAIGGITSGNYPDVLSAGAYGACVMSSCMQCPDVSRFMEEFDHDI